MSVITTSSGTLTIRALTREEIPLCFPSGEAFYAEVSLPGRFSAMTFLDSWQKFYDRHMGVILGLWLDGRYIGGLGGIIAPDPNTGDLTGVECFWYVMPEHRGARMGIRLVDAFEVWAREHGASHVIMVYVHGREGNTLDRLYQRRGYRELETCYVKDL